MEMTEEQRQRAESNRLAALAKRKALAESSSTINQQDPWRLFKCRKISTDHHATAIPRPKHPPSSFADPSFPKPQPPAPPPVKFRARLEICSPDSFSVAPDAVEGFAYPGEAACLEKLSDCLSNVVLVHYTQNHGGGKACVYKLGDYDSVLRCLKNYKGVEIEEIPWGTLNVIGRLSHSLTEGRWLPCRPEQLSNERVDEYIRKLPKMLLDALLPFQLEGVRFGLQRGGRCLIADEMGLGKTLQAIAIACCFMTEGPVLVVCPAILRFSWAEELERWLPFCSPSDFHLVFGRKSNPAHLTRCPKVVVTSYTMLHRLRKSMLEREWAVLIVDESHHVRCTKKASEPGEIKAVLDVATKINRIVLLSGTPSLSRPGLLGKDKYEFARTYCSVKFFRGCQGRTYQDFSKGVRLEELNVLLKQTVMIRRLKKHVLVQLPPKRRQIISLQLKRSDVISAMSLCEVVKSNASGNEDAKVPEDATEDPLEISDELDDRSSCRESLRILSWQQIGIAKLSGFLKWLSMHPIFAESDGVDNLELGVSSHKMIIFAHHHKVMDGVQEDITWCMMFADDIVLVDETSRCVNTKLEIWREALESKGFRISRSKTGYMVCKFGGTSSAHEERVMIQDQEIPKSDYFKYLGSIISSDGEIADDVTHRIQVGWLKWRSATGVLCDKRVLTKLKGKFYGTAIRPAMLYGTECWPIKKQQVNKMSVAEMRMLRWVCGKTRRDKIRNETVREMVGVAPIQEKVRENRLRWFGHGYRRPEDAVVKRADIIALDSNATGRENQGTETHIAQTELQNNPADPDQIQQPGDSPEIDRWLARVGKERRRQDNGRRWSAEFLCDKGIGFVRINGLTPPGDRQIAVNSFQLSKEASTNHDLNFVEFFPLLA
ncbi:hypothetical protein RHMOL_Rhmol08G0203600 [Rhododendron molle]|uniref:Uncharacterized protein n=1 Tax=Rhododendron molle TaxID=49168 RepID=A0ACC0MQE9_RHOML|nr:hypothetical protein RHMOL_Rhmol08G0203600 [Rhododendron molle]